MENNLPLRDLQKIILGERSEPLSNVEIKNLFNYPTTPESILYIITSLNRNKIDPNTTLIHGIDNANNKEDLVPIALSLRYGADPNLYVNVPNVGDIHILGFVYITLINKSLALLNSVVILLIAMGSDPNTLIFDAKGGIIKDEYSLVEPLKGQSVIDWLEEQGYDTILNQIEGQKYNDVEPDFMTMLATFIDNPELIPKDNKPRLDEVVGSHSIEMFNKYINNYNQINLGIKISLDYLNLNTFERFVDLGGSLNYGEINDLILTIKKYKDVGDIISYGQVREMLLYSISKGLILDEYQASIIRGIDDKLFQKIKVAYEQPYWTKICNVNKGMVDIKLKLLAYQLNLYPEAPKDTLCYQIKQIAQADPELVKQSTIIRQQVRIKSDVAYINQFDDGNNPPDIECNNRSLLYNLYDFPDVDIAYYRDYQDALWCFTSNNFLKMVEKEINPYTNQVFPKYFLDKVNEQINFISKYRSIEDDATPISIVINNLSLPDIINNEYTNKKVKGFETLLVENDILSWNIKNLDIDDMEQIINNNFKIKLNFKDLSRDHAEKTFSIVAFDELNKSESTDGFFKDIKEKSMSKEK